MPPPSPAPSSRVINPELPTVDPQISVFINCPYDHEYRPLLHALVFTTVCCGLQPRMADESEAIDVPRMERIAHALFNSNYSIHDLCRCRGEGDELLARFNMPLELGLAMGRRYAGLVFADGAGDAPAPNHRWLVLIPDEVSHDRFASDLKGFDPTTYDGTVESIVPSVLRWLRTIPSATPGLAPSAIVRALGDFEQEIRRLEAIEWLTGVPWDILIETARRLVPKL